MRQSIAAVTKYETEPGMEDIRHFLKIYIPAYKRTRFCSFMLRYKKYNVGFILTDLFKEEE